LNIKPVDSVWQFKKAARLAAVHVENIGKDDGRKRRHTLKTTSATDGNSGGGTRGTECGTNDTLKKKTKSLIHSPQNIPSHAEMFYELFV
jgi:hypothetical protein